MNDAQCHLAQFNFARIRAELDDPIMLGFTSNLQRINRLADEHPGFVWRLKTDKGDSTDIRPYDDDRLLVTFSIWESIESLEDFVYHHQHAEIMRGRRQWFEHIDGFYIVLWWISAGDIPSIEEAKQRMEHLQTHGPTPFAFTFEETFPVTAVLERKEAEPAFNVAREVEL
jgi:heme-degrading monooxygenase HmoA